MKIKFNLINGGTCTRLKLFGEDIRKLLISNNWVETYIQQADYIFINSCSFLKSKEDYFVQLIKDSYEIKNNKQKIVVFGCLPSTNPLRIKNIDLEAILFSRKIEDIVSFFKLKDNIRTPSTIVDNDLNFSQRLIQIVNRLFLRDSTIDFRLMKKNVYHLKISEGCSGRCSYCSEKFTTRLKSRKISELRESFKIGMAAGFKLFSLNSDDSSSFGKDNNESISELLSNLISFSGDFKIALSEFNPQGLSYKNIVRILSSDKISYITIPIQSGSQEILSRMRRPYQINMVLTRIKEIIKLNPKLKINTHLIVGFPGETSKDFNKTLDIVKSGLFDRIKVFKYSDRPGTEASNFSNKIDERTKIIRAKKLQKSILINSFKKLDFANFLLNLNQI